MKSFPEICADIGAPLKNPRWSWCALAPDGKRAIFTLWQDCFHGKRYPMTHKQDRATSRNPNRPGWVEMQHVVEQCLQNPETQLFGVLCKAKDINADPRVREWVNDRELLVLNFERSEDGEVWAVIAGRKDR
jgi:5-methylcytosine-specific restriction protein A